MMPTHLQGRHPVEVGTLAACAGCGLMRSIAAAQPSTINSAMGTAMGALWGALFALGALLALTGIYWRGELEASLHLERAGLIAVCGALATALFAIVVRTPITSEVVGPLVLGIGGGLGMRAWRISRVIARATAEARAQAEMQQQQREESDAPKLGFDPGNNAGGERSAMAADPVALGTSEDRGGHSGSLHEDGGVAGEPSRKDSSARGEGQREAPRAERDAPRRGAGTA